MKDTKKSIDKIRKESAEDNRLLEIEANGFNDGIKRAIEIIGLDDNKCYQSYCYGCILDLKELLEKELKK